MKRTALALTLILAISVLTVTSMPFSEGKPGAFEVQWQRRLPGISGSAVVQTQDGGYLILGTNASWVQVNDQGGRMYVNHEPILVKTDSSGNLLWERTYKFEGAKLDLSIIVQTVDGGYALGGLGEFDTTEEGKMSSFTNRIYLLKIDSEGDTQWSRLLPSYNDTYSDVYSGSFGVFIQTRDGGYAFATGFNHMMYLNEIWFVKTDSEGNLEFSREVDSPLSGPISLSQTDEGYAIVGSIFGRGGSGGRVGIARIDAEGNTQGHTLYGESHDQMNPYGRCGVPTSDGGFVIGGHFGVGRQGWIIKTSAEDVMLWDRTYQLGESYTVIDSISQTEDDGYIFVASAQESRSVSSETRFFTWAGKTDGLGTVERQISFLGASNPRSVMETDDGGYVFVGTWRLNDVGNQETWFVKLSSGTIPPDQLPPSVLILSPENKLYPLGNISLTYVIDETIMRVNYSLDDQANATLVGNTTIIGLPEGAHTLKIYGFDGVGNTETSETDFSVGETFPTILIIEIIVLVVIVAIASFALGSRTTNARSTRKLEQ